MIDTRTYKLEAHPTSDAPLKAYRMDTFLNKHLFLVLFILFLAIPTAELYASNHPPFTGDDFSNKPCSGNRGAYGPFDYNERANYPRQLRLVEGSHFTPMVESLTDGNRSSTPYGDIAYTLRAWPNHHRALNSLSRYQFRLKNNSKSSIRIPAECWFQRAINYSPNDATVYMLYAMHLQKHGKLKLAETNYQKALKLDQNHTQTHYNYGLLLVKKKQYKRAREHAQVAYKRSFPLAGLKNKLKKVGHWP